VTAFGAAKGAAVTAAIGPDGGTIATADGAIQVVFPAGAVATTTTFTLQPVENLSPGGAGPSFELTPSDVALAQPLQVTMAFTAADLAAGGSEALSVATQDDTGAWYAFQSGVTLTPVSASAVRAGPSPRASDVVLDRLGFLLRQLNKKRAVALYSELILSPRNATVHTGKSVTLTAGICTPAPATPPASGDDLGPLPSCKTAPNQASSTSATAGTFVESSTAHFTYTAPSSVPSPNPVTVTARYDRVGGSSTSVILVAPVTVLGDAPASYSGKITLDFTTPGTFHFVGSPTVDFHLTETLPGDLWKYETTSTVSVTATLVNCDPKTVQIPLTGSLIVFDAVRTGAGDQYAGKYRWGVGGGVVDTFQCNGTSVQGAVVLSAFSDCPEALVPATSWTDQTHLTGSAAPACGASSASIAGTVSWDLAGQ